MVAREETDRLPLPPPDLAAKLAEGLALRQLLEAAVDGLDRLEPVPAGLPDAREDHVVLGLVGLLLDGDLAEAGALGDARGARHREREAIVREHPPARLLARGGLLEVGLDLERSILVGRIGREDLVGL